MSDLAAACDWGHGSGKSVAPECPHSNGRSALAWMESKYERRFVSHHVRHWGAVLHGVLNRPKTKCRPSGPGRGARTTRRRHSLNVFQLMNAHDHRLIRGDEIRALRRLQREQEPKSPFVFTSERSSPCTTCHIVAFL